MNYAGNNVTQQHLCLKKESNLEERGKKQEERSAQEYVNLRESLCYFIDSDNFQKCKEN